MVIVVTEGGEQIIDLGDGAASVTVTVNSDGTSLSVETSGDVNVVEIDWAAEEAAFESCEDQLPDNAFGPVSFFEDDMFDGEMFDGEMFDGEMFDGEMFDGEMFDGEIFHDQMFGLGGGMADVSELTS